ncbi:HDOD domain-containing protein [Thiospirochaeta perfilievii]|uniref:HDOD domain-containing protein n=1 Tax=Thiospirochaeta perfilievii TaxID=252967 RepID=A0A5C1QEE9_9SPIO|nr:HDOD domain-containing protein [Thiospirochaeta perfilievii]QEN05767.1 HDOD domain-containing protein [Thiospirochaeta perfilievii]
MTSIYNKYIFDLPIIPKVVSDILAIPSNVNISSKEIEKILIVDPYLTSRMLKIANSSFYSRQREINSIKDAITLIGLKKVKTICLLIAGSEIINNKKDIFYKKFWSEAINTAFIAKSIACDTGKSVIEDDIFTAGLLHNIGQAILFNFSDENYKNVLNKMKSHKRRLIDVEMEEFGINNHKVGAGVLHSWEFPQLLIDSVENHLNISSHSQFQNVIDIVSISKLLSQKIDNSYNEELYNDLFLVYQSRLNLRQSQIDFYINEYYDDISSTPFYNICLDIVFS